MEKCKHGRLVPQGKTNLDMCSKCRDDAPKYWEEIKQEIDIDEAIKAETVPFDCVDLINQPIGVRLKGYKGVDLPMEDDYSEESSPDIVGPTDEDLDEDK
jgi:hypothetical protein